MAYDQATLTTMRILDCELVRHQVPDTLGSHISGIEKTLASLTTLIGGSTEPTDAANILAAIQAISTSVAALGTQLDGIIATQTAQTAVQTSQTAQLNFIVQVLNHLQDNPVPLPS